MNSTCRAQAGALSSFPSSPPASMVDIWVHPRHGGLQEMILKERKWTAKAIQQRRSLQKDEKEAKIVEAPAQKEALERAGVKRAWWFVIIGKGSDDRCMSSVGVPVETYVDRSRNGCLLPTNVSIGPEGGRPPSYNIPGRLTTLAAAAMSVEDLNVVAVQLAKPLPASDMTGFALSYVCGVKF
ncbi:unnamed protein product, partial [Symbiodinium necroappetens]